MAPRRYRMTRRDEAEQQTRQRIVAAAVELHGRQGVAATSWDDVAAAAGVNRATVYRHFRGLDELIPVCARRAFEAMDLPSRPELEAAMAGLHGPDERLAHVVRETCECYERGATWLRAAYRERDLIPALREATDRIRNGVATLLEVALAGRTVDPATRAVLVVLADYPFWQQLVDAGISPADAPSLITTTMQHLLTVKGASR